MKKLIAFTLVFTCFTLSGYTRYIQDSILQAERDYYWNRYTGLRDTLTINTWNNLKRMKDNLEEVVKRDAIIIETLRQGVQMDSALVENQADMNARYNELAASYDDLQSRIQNDAQMMLYLKAAVGVLLLIAVILIFTLIGRSAALKKARTRANHFESVADQRNQMVDLQESELRRLKDREIEFREELEKGITSHQERLISIQQRNNDLEHEIEQLKNEYAEAVKHTQAEASVNEDTANASQEHESLFKLVEHLNKKLEEEKKRRERLVEKVRNLAEALAGLNEGISE